MHNSIHVPEHRKVLFIHIQRTGGTALMNYLIKYRHPAHLILTGHKSYKEFEQTHHDLEEYFKFTMVRNPWDRLVSWHKLLRKINPANQFSLEEFINDQEELEAASKDTFGFFLNQVDYLTDLQDNLRVNLIGRFENYLEETERIFNKISVQVFEVPIENATSKDDYRKYYTDQLAERVSLLCHKDIKMFNYKFD
jgi:hypothetical protein